MPAVCVDTDQDYEVYVQAGGVQDNDGVDRKEYYGLSEVQGPDGQQENISPNYDVMRRRVAKRYSVVDDPVCS